MNRTPPTEVLRVLRREVGFGCPVPGCGNPYLEWHHFDPPWREREHHDPTGMIALCGEHHDKAGVGTFTPEQLRRFKTEALERAAEVAGRFDWLRNRMLAVVGGNFYYETPVILRVRGESAIWFNRDDDGHLLLNVRMLTTSGQPRMQLDDNFWITRGDMADLECPPSGRLVRAVYGNGDELRVEFFECASPLALAKRYLGVNAERWRVEFPITAVEVTCKVGGTELSFGPRWTTLPGGGFLQNAFMAHNHVGIVID